MGGNSIHGANKGSMVVSESESKNIGNDKWIDDAITVSWNPEHWKFTEFAQIFFS